MTTKRFFCVPTFFREDWKKRKRVKSQISECNIQKPPSVSTGCFCYQQICTFPSSPSVSNHANLCAGFHSNQSEDWLIRLIVLPPSGLKRLLAAVPSPFHAISLSLTPPSSISFSISTSHSHTRLQIFLLWNRLYTISLSQYSLLMVSCSRTAAPLIRSV